MTKSLLLGNNHSTPSGSRDCCQKQQTLRPGCIKRCQFVVKVNILSSDLIGGYLTLNLNQPIKWANFRLDALLADTMLTKLYATGPESNMFKIFRTKKRRSSYIHLDKLPNEQFKQK
jgi:hypothetical protein